MSIRIFKIKDVDKYSNFTEIVKRNLSKRIKQDDIFAKNFYASLCNTVWFNKSTQDIYSCSWRYAGGFVAKIRRKGENYLDFYCSGEEGEYHRDVYNELNKLGYKALKDKKINLISETFKDCYL
jgi:hypothetical protein